jgi:CAAX prenyl protease-like protein
MSERPAGAGPWPYVLPYLGFGLVVALRDAAPAAWAGPGALAQVVVPAALLGAFAARGAYPELRGFRPGAAGLGADLALGLAVAALWVGPFLLFAGLPRPGSEAAFDPQGLGSRVLTLAVRALGFALVTPFMEELFVRSFLLRAIDAWREGEDFEALPVGRFAWASFLGTVLWFTVTHERWEWIVALPAGVVYNLWLYRRRHLGSLVLAHAATNAAILAGVAWAAPSHPGLWVFL